MKIYLTNEKNVLKSKNMQYTIQPKIYTQLLFNLQLFSVDDLKSLHLISVAACRFYIIFLSFFLYYLRGSTSVPLKIKYC